MELNIIKPYSAPEIVIKQYYDAHCPNEEVYLLPKGFSMITIHTLQMEIDYYRKLSEHRLKGINYWKGRAK